MERLYELSAEAILYSVLTLERAGIYGVRDVLSGKTKEEFSAMMQQAEMELMMAGLGTMDFDGGFTLDDNFAEAVAACADRGDAWSAARRQDGQMTELTLYPGEETYALLRRTDGMYELGLSEQPMQDMMAFLDLPETKTLHEVCVSSKLLQDRNISGLTDAGCSPELAQLAVDAATGAQTYAQFTRVREYRPDYPMNVLTGLAGAVLVQVEYTDSDEMFRLTPVDAAWLRQTLADWQNA